MAQQVQLFTVAGELVATVDVEMTLAGKWPVLVDYGSRTFVLQNGRYVEAADDP